jgi:ubiquinone/menaquinone biosynthesis C-methylase UbiE
MILMRNGKNGKQGKKKAIVVEDAVQKRYTAGAEARQESLCCPVEYEGKYLALIPKEIVERDYGCGDPSRYLREGDTVLDLGCGAGKICYIAAQIVGPEGRVIGVDFNDAMLALARKHEGAMAGKLGYQNVEFRKGKIQDLTLNLDRLDEYLAKHPARSADDFLSVETYCDNMARRDPLIPDESVDVIVSNCVLNLVRTGDKTQLFREMHRVLKKGGRVAISDIVSDEDVPRELENDPELWTGCIAGAFREDLFLAAFEEAGFYGITVESLAREPFRTVKGIQFRSVTVTALKGKEGPCLERNQAVIYKGPWKTVEDDDHHILKRGLRSAVCDKTYQIFSKAPYKNDIILVPPRKEVPYAKAKVFDCMRSEARHPRETKGRAYHNTTQPEGSSCEPRGGCC